MKIEMICTGEEVLSGQIVDTNAAWFGNQLMDLGIEMERRVTVGDRLEDLTAVFQERSLYADVIIVNGGLGPTTDDMSALAMANAKNEALVENTQWRETLEAWYSDRGRTMPASNAKQAQLPATAIMIDNPVGTACGFRVKLNRAWLFFTPGVPHEFKQMVQEQFIPFIQQEFDLEETTQLQKLLTFGIGESTLADELDQLPIPEHITMGYRSSMPHIEIKLFARGENAIEALPDVTARVKAVLGDALVSENHPTLAAEIHHLLLQQKKTLSLAESCTGGLIASQLVDFPGSSNYLQHCLVTYCNAAKTTLLNVSEAIINQYGAVSIETVEAMASGARNILDSDYALATSGVAGPDGGSDDKPVGTVTIALASKSAIWSQQVHIPINNRSMIRTITCAIAYDMLRRALLGKDPVANYSFIKKR
ncbi:damage-inducible protein CinA [Gammaproteobacteria bacterium 45_16_T64]|nr:damage-inducible protein CinA [Gammaproteobacteria bacterium 45_16_T64]